MSRTAVLVALILVGPLWAQLECPAPVHEAGLARTGTTLVHDFALVNAGRTPLALVGVKTGCGCLKAVPGKTVLSPGERTALRLEAATATQAAGKNAWRVTVRYRQDDAEKEAQVVLAADLVADISVTPATMVLHATAFRVQHPFTLIERRPEPMRLLSVQCTTPHVEAVAGAPRKESERWTRPIALRVLPTCPEGRLEASLHLSSAEFPDLRVPFSVVKRSASAVQASPASLTLAREGASSLPSRLVLLDSGDKAVGVKHIKTGHPAIRATWAKGPGNRATMRLTFDEAKLGPAELLAEVEVEVSEPAAQTLRVPVTIGAPRPPR